MSTAEKYRSRLLNVAKRASAGAADRRTRTVLTRCRSAGSFAPRRASTRMDFILLLRALQYINGNDVMHHVRDVLIGPLEPPQHDRHAAIVRINATPLKLYLLPSPLRAQVGIVLFDDRQTAGVTLREFLQLGFGESASGTLPWS